MPNRETFCTAFCGDVIFTIFFEEGSSRPYTLRQHQPDSRTEKTFSTHAEALEEQYLALVKILDSKI